jgi:hypothetical protein
MTRLSHAVTAVRSSDKASVNGKLVPQCLQDSASMSTTTGMITML